MTARTEAEIRAEIAVLKTELDSPKRKTQSRGLYLVWRMEALQWALGEVD